LQAGVDSKLLTLYKYSTNIPQHYQVKKSDYVWLPLAQKGVDYTQRKLQALKIKVPFYTKISSKYLTGRPPGFEFFSFPVSEYQLEKHPLVKEADVIHLHWVSEGFLNFKSFFEKLNKKVVWTFHDMGPFTGGCHHSDGCMGFKGSCSACPQLVGTINPEIAAHFLAQKLSAISHYQGKDLTVITPSKWLGNLSQESILFKRFAHHNIYSVTDTAFSFQNKKQELRKKWNLPLDKKIVLYVSHQINNERKGIKYLLEAQKLWKTKDVLLCSLGSVDERLNQNENMKQLGYINESEAMAELYNAADLFVLPSLAENFPNTILESILCGTPVVAFGVGGIPEQIDNENGIVVEPKSSDKLAKAFDTFFENQGAYSASVIAQQAKEKYSTASIVQQYLKIYNA
jgi:glycosyltransferase involved in cell wall biosynthesis